MSDGRAESRTRTRELTRDPIWDEVLPLVISDPQKAALQISVCGFSSNYSMSEQRLWLCVLYVLSVAFEEKSVIARANRCSTRRRRNTAGR